VKSNRVRKKLVEELRKTPIVIIACKRVGIAPATFYRWKKRDEKLAEQIDEAIQEGRLLINDMSESVIIHKIKDGDVATAKYWLRYHHPVYSEKIKVIKPAEPKDDGKLTPEEMELIDKAIRLNFPDFKREKNQDKKSEN
jgi:hypothetical protein